MANKDLHYIYILIKQRVRGSHTLCIHPMKARIVFNYILQIINSFVARAGQFLFTQGNLLCLLDVLIFVNRTYHSCIFNI